ncbi:MepB family protein [Rhodococcus sp. NPDC060086]|uniref:MepB family protein n=1 Tax=Rhodococcus sp. NPDC060086 TaxID=3347055 RepID=UPI0036592FA7
MTFSAFEAYAATVGVTASVMPEAQNSDYESGIARIGEERWHIRTARTTPTKPGAFLAFWTRDLDGVTAPFSTGAVHAGLLVFVEQYGKRGVFRFTAPDLAKLGVTSESGPGKRGFRVYPDWCMHLNATATATQRAQSAAFQAF